ncbi:Helitron helicase [Phytophthora megakarya]|uniref:Helitron helicase n=1 Tax=Phytophthora megakarya TaxID=4795 RepID=A0A225UB72_9STRA|nr:Helitron helicase [Phytophthora megakarya]
MICNLNSDAGLCNGTRLRFASLRERSIEATVMPWPANRNTMFLPRNISYTENDDKEFPFKLKLPPFAMTINKAQGQSSHHVGIYLKFICVCARSTECCYIQSHFTKSN